MSLAARRAGDDWYLAGINAEDTDRRIILDLAATGHTAAQLISDGESPRKLRQIEVNGIGQAVTMAPGGGFVMIIHP